MAKPATFDHLKSKKKPVVRKVPICLDPDLSQELDQEQQKLVNLEARALVIPDPSDDLRKEIEEQRKVTDAIGEKVRATTQVFKFRSIGRVKYDKLISEHPPTEEEINEWVEKRGGREEDVLYSPSSFPIALVAKCCIDPIMTKEQVQEIWDSEDWNNAELQALFQGALEANNVRSILELGKG